MDVGKFKFSWSYFYQHFFIVLFSQTLFFAEILSASPDFLTLQSRIVQPDGQYLEAVSVNYRISITDPVGTCVVFQEDYSNVSMVNSKGLVAIKIGSGVKSHPVAPTTMKDIFTNFNSPVFNCQSGGTYTAASSDQRKLVMQFNDGSGWQTVPGMEINSVPFALESLSSQKLGAFPAGDYVRAAQFATCGAGEAVHFNGTNFTCVVTGGAATSVAAGAGLVGTPSISFSGDTNTGLYSGAADTISISNNGSNTFNITASTLASTTTGGASITQTNGTAGAPTFAFTGDADTGWFRAAADTLAASTAGAERIRIDSAGNVGVGTTAPDFPFSLGDGSASDGGILARGYGVVGSNGTILAASGAGTRMIWYPRKSSFRAGTVNGSQWDDANTGLYSTAFGNGTIASGARSTAFGEGSQANGSVATALGYFSYGNGTYSLAAGQSVTADSYAQVSIGKHNMPTGTENPTSWITTDPLFVIGNGTGGGASRANAMTVLKNGYVGVGTPSPTSKLEVKETTNTILSMQIMNAHGGDQANSSIVIGQTTAGQKYGLLGYMSPTTIQSGPLRPEVTVLGGYASAGLSLLAMDNSGYMTFATGGLNEQMRITSAGNVGIGTTSPTEKLEVSGNILLSKDANRSIRVNDSDTDGVNGGGLTLAAGGNSGNTTANGGSVQISAGNGQLSGSGGSVSISAGNGGLINSTTGSVTINGGGSNTTGANPGGAVSILGGWGFGATNAGGAVALTGGTALSGNNNGGSVVIGGGAGSGTGVAGNIILAATSGKVGIGTASPTAKLNIEDTAGTNAYGFILNHTGIGGSTGAALRAYQNAASSTAYAIMAEKTTQGGGAVFGNSSSQAGSSGVGVYGITYGAASSAGVAAHNVGINNTGYAVFANNNSATGWGVYSFGTSPNYFAGNVGIGTTSPQTTLQVEGVISPATNNAYTLGNASYRFTEVYATNGVINTSDRREKKDISSTDLGLDFINKLRPVTYRWNTGVDNDVHYGLIAQETEQALSEIGKNEKTSIVTHDEATDRYGVRYSELISPLIKAAQELYSRLMDVEAKTKEIEKLKQENAAIKIRLDKIEKALSSQ